MDLLGFPHDHVLGVATFYTMYFKRPMGKHHLQICTKCIMHASGEVMRFMIAFRKTGN
ncbi:MAG: NAD(P)H-dependent oxidoreductase subunit E [Ignavibacteria bacterium]